MGKPLHQPSRHKHKRRSGPDGTVGRGAGDDQAAQGGKHQGAQHDRLASETVRQSAGQHRSNRPREKADGENAEHIERRGKRAVLREKNNLEKK